MTYSNQFAIAIRDSKGNILREYDRKVYLPFNSEYSIFLKNMNPCRAMVDVSIDGTDVLGGSRLVIGAHESINLERFMPVNKKFLFVPAGDSRVQDPSSGQNGLVTVTFTKEASFSPYVIYGDNVKYTYTNNSSILRGATTSSNTFFSCNAEPVGATVEGGYSGQAFVDVGGFTVESISSVLTLQLLGADTSVTAKDTRKQHCTSCGRKVKFNDNYCGSCGTKV